MANPCEFVLQYVVQLSHTMPHTQPSPAHHALHFRDLRFLFGDRARQAFDLLERGREVNLEEKNH